MTSRIVSLDEDAAAITDALSIAAVERQTGIRPATLRMWEKRYGFPQPLRDRHGNRVYPLVQVERLLGARRLLDQGIRPSRIFSESVAFDPALVPYAEPCAAAGPYQPIFDLLLAYRLADLHRHFEYRLLELGLRRFVIEFLAPLSNAVGLAWANGTLPVRCEHLYSQVAMSFLHAKQAAVRTAGARGPKAVLATLTGESHALGILAVEAVLATLEVDCVQLGSDVPLQEVVAAARETGADIVALSFTSWFPRNDALRAIRTLRAALPSRTVVWVGGQGAPDAAALGPGIFAFDTLAAIEPALLFWRSRTAAEHVQLPTTR